MSLRSVVAAGAKISPPSWLPDNLCYETMMGSVAYGVSADTSDMDVYGICLPPKDTVFPHLAGEIFGFGTQIKRFETWQEHHVAAFDKVLAVLERAAVVSGEQPGERGLAVEQRGTPQIGAVEMQ